MKRIAFLSVGLFVLGAGCWSKAPERAPVIPPTPVPVVEQAASSTPEVKPAEPIPSVPDKVKPDAMKKTTPPAIAKPVVPKAVEPTYVTVTMSQDGFKPAQITIKKDTIVRFKNVGNDAMWPASNPHPIHTSYQDFDARRGVKPGETYEFKFKNVGSWGCHDHVSPGLTCRIIVQE